MMKKDWKQHIRRRVELDRSEHKTQKQESNENLSATYAKTKEEYQFKTTINMDDFRAIPKDVMNLGLSPSALGVYIVLCGKSDFEKHSWFKMPIDEIVFFSGRSMPTVHRALDELCQPDVCIRFDDGKKKPLIEREKHTKGKTHFWKYRVFYFRGGLIDVNKSNQFFFFNGIVNNGYWADLSAQAQASYLYLRKNAVFDSELYGTQEYGEDGTSHAFWEAFEKDGGYKYRRYDVVKHISKAEISREVGITYRNMDEIIRQLERLHLITWVNVWCVVKRFPYAGPIFDESWDI